MQTRSFHNLAAFVVRCAVIGLAAAFVISVFAPRLVERLRGVPATERGVAAPTHGPQSYAPAVARASPAVVNNYANKMTTYRPPTAQVIDPLTMRLLGYVRGPAMSKLSQNLGSGVIFSAGP